MIFFEIKEIGPTPGILKKELNPILKRTWAAGAKWWHAQIRPKHFKKSGAREYRYRPRDGERAGDFHGRKVKGRIVESYTKRKLREKGHTRPLTFKGMQGGSQARTAFARITSTKTGAKVKMNAPTLNFRPAGWPHTLRQELLIVSPKDLTDITRIMRRFFQAEIKKVRRTKREVIK